MLGFIYTLLVKTKPNEGDVPFQLPSKQEGKKQKRVGRDAIASIAVTSQ